MESGKRRIKDGRAYDALFPPPGGSDTTIRKKAGVEDTVKLIRATVPQTLWQTRKIARALRGNTLDETCSNIWHFVYDHIQYKKDEDGVEQVRSPRRTWRERQTGVDCDCYTELISSILCNLGVPHKARITQYPKRPPEVPRWQHIYPVVPLDGNADRELADRDGYIVLDCVKDEYDDEQPFLKAKDYTMRLDYLDGLHDVDEEAIYEDEDMFEPAPGAEDIGYEYVYETVDAQGIGDLYDDELGLLKKLRRKLRKTARKVGKGIKKTAKKVGKTVGKGIRVINRYANPATLLLRNGFLLAMKGDMFNVAEKLRYAYLSDAQAQAMGINLHELKRLRKIKDKAETIYWQAGGKKSNLKKAILGGKGNKDKKVRLQGLAGPEDEEYADMDEYNILHTDQEELEGLGVIATGTAIAAASGAVAAVKTALSQIKNLFSKGGGDDLVSKISTAVQTTRSAVDQVKTSLLPQTQQPLPAAPPVEPVPSYALPATPGSFPATTVRTEQLPATTAADAPADDQKQGFLAKTTAWVKENPGKSLLVAGAAIGGGFLLAKALSSPASKPVSGLDGAPKKRKTKRKPGSAGKKVHPVEL